MQCLQINNQRTCANRAKCTVLHVYCPCHTPLSAVRGQLVRVSTVRLAVTVRCTENGGAR